MAPSSLPFSLHPRIHLPSLSADLSLLCSPHFRTAPFSSVPPLPRARLPSKYTLQSRSSSPVAPHLPSPVSIFPIPLPSLTHTFHLTHSFYCPLIPLPTPHLFPVMSFPASLFFPALSSFSSPPAVPPRSLSHISNHFDHTLFYPYSVHIFSLL